METDEVENSTHKNTVSCQKVPKLELDTQLHTWYCLLEAELYNGLQTGLGKISIYGDHCWLAGLEFVDDLKGDSVTA